MRSVIPISLPENQAAAVRRAADDLGLSLQDVIRQTVKLYLPAFCEKMSLKPKHPRRLSAWDALRGKPGDKLKIHPRNPFNEPVEKVEL